MFGSVEPSQRQPSQRKCNAIPSMSTQVKVVYIPDIFWRIPFLLFLKALIALDSQNFVVM